MKVSEDRRRIVAENRDWWQQRIAAAGRRFAQAEERLSTCEDGSDREAAFLKERERALEEAYEARTEARRLHNLLRSWDREEAD